MPARVTVSSALKYDFIENRNSLKKKEEAKLDRLSSENGYIKNEEPESHSSAEGFP